MTIEELAQILSGEGRLLGLDVGTKTIGIAVSDVNRTVATALGTIRRTKFREDVGKIAEICAANQAVGFIVGLPLNMDGSEGPRAQSARAFVRNLRKHTNLPIVLWDERLSTAAAERALLAADASRKRRAEVIDKLAAAFILQGALDRLRNI